MIKKLMALGCISLVAIPHALYAATTCGYVDLGGGAGLIGNAFDHRYEDFGPVANARVGGGVIFNSDNSTRFMGVNAHYNTFGYADANLAFGRHLSDKVDYSLLLGADFSDKFIVPRLGADLTYKVSQHFAISGEVGFDAVIFPSAWLSARYNF